MNTQGFVQITVAFLAGITCVNVLVSFIELWVEERRKCSIIDGTRQKRGFIISAAGKKKKYAALHMAERTA